MLWIRDALIDRGKTQRDLAEAWDVDDAVVSRFLNHGVPKLDFDRMETLSTLLEMDFNELRLRVQEGLAPQRHPAQSKPPAHQPKAPDFAKDPISTVLQDVRAAVGRLQLALPEAQVRVTICYGGKDMEL